MTAEIERRLAVEADRLAVLYERILLAARDQRVSFLETGREAVAKGLVPLGDWDLLREVAENPQAPTSPDRTNRPRCGRGAPPGPSSPRSS